MKKRENEFNSTSFSRKHGRKNATLCFQYLRYNHKINSVNCLHDNTAFYMTLLCLLKYFVGTSSKTSISVLSNKNTYFLRLSVSNFRPMCIFRSNASFKDKIQLQNAQSFATVRFSAARVKYQQVKINSHLPPQQLNVK